jgi:hypothetical protein
MLSFTIAPASLHRLRQRLSPAGTGVAAGILQDAGVASGEALGAAWRAHVAERAGVDDAGQLDAHWFGPLLGELCDRLGWGTIGVTELADRALLLSSANWAEAEPASAAHPGCYFTCGCLAAFLSGQAGAPLAVLEVECRSSGSEQCRFLAASPECVSAVYDLVAAGGNWREAFATPGTSAVA